MKKLKTEKLKSKIKRLKAGAIFIESVLYIVACLGVGFLFSNTIANIGLRLLTMIGCDFAVLIGLKAGSGFLKSKAKQFKNELEEYRRNDEKGQKEYALLKEIEQTKAIIKDKKNKTVNPKLVEESKTLLQRLLLKKQRMVNPVKIKFTDQETGETFEADLVDNLP